jgi:hypothetical protein
VAGLRQNHAVTQPDLPRSPSARRLAQPSWLDGRLVLGVLLVLASVLGGAKVLASADVRESVWVAARDLAPGTTLGSADLRREDARLFATGDRYLTGAAPVGYVVLRPLGAGELVPAAALGAPGEQGARREVTVPVGGGHLPPDLARGQQVDVYVTPSEQAAKRAGGAEAFAPRLVLRGATVARVVRPSGLVSSAADLPVVLAVPQDEVEALVQALADGRLDLVRVPLAQQAQQAAG